jgi:hypothetical protein
MKIKLSELRSLIKQQFNEGFSDLSVGGSDTAWDCMYLIKQTICKILAKELKQKGNNFNTEGFVNVAMILEEYFKNTKIFSRSDDEFVKIKGDCMEALGNELKRLFDLFAKADKNEKKHYRVFIIKYQRLIESLKKF